jgi:hypothetical protein
VPGFTLSTSTVLSKFRVQPPRQTEITLGREPLCRSRMRPTRHQTGVERFRSRFGQRTAQDTPPVRRNYKFKQPGPAQIDAAPAQPDTVKPVLWPRTAADALGSFAENFRRAFAHLNTRKRTSFRIRPRQWPVATERKTVQGVVMHPAKLYRTTLSA